MKKNITCASEVIGTIEQDQFLGPYKIQIENEFTGNSLFSTLQFLIWLCNHNNRLYLYKSEDALDPRFSKILIFDGVVVRPHDELFDSRLIDINDHIDKSFKKLSNMEISNCHVCHTCINCTECSCGNIGEQLDVMFGISSNELFPSLQGRQFPFHGKYNCDGVNDWIIIEHNELFKFELFSQVKGVDPITIKL